MDGRARIAARRPRNGLAPAETTGRYIRMKLQPGEIAPDFKVRSHEGKEFRLSDYRGRTVVLWFYPKADTPG